MSKNTNKTGLFQPALRQFILVQSQIMTQLMQKSRVNLVPENLLIAFGKIPFAHAVASLSGRDSASVEADLRFKIGRPLFS